MEVDIHDEIKMIRLKLEDIHNEMRRFMEESNQMHLESILTGFRNDYSGVILNYATAEIENCLESNMVRNCHMKETCKTLFSDLLESNIRQIRDGKISNKAINETKSKLEQMRQKAPYEQCKECFSEAARLLNKHIDIMQSLRVYQDGIATDLSAKELSEEDIVSNMLEPLSNKQRLQILKALSAGTKTFSALSALTNLRGGNLLFHLQKLIDGEMILQRHERGDYMITEKGFRILRGILELYSDLNR
ncbi:winged helix-turn-helix domain-containing protein [Methanothrix sp.]|uniref:winged helix-turn-helix domain-containing protein n=1 Tax=Methanothrix sp. TaxID=90426 RepID=UPI003C73FE30